MASRANGVATDPSAESVAVATKRSVLRELLRKVLSRTSSDR